MKPFRRLCENPSCPYDAGWCDGMQCRTEEELEREYDFAGFDGDDEAEIM